jgi:arsenate reductase
MKKKVLFFCNTNSCRSQMAEGILKLIGKGEFEVYSAGVEVTSVHPLARQVMREKGIDISEQSSKSVSEFTGQEFDYVITLCGDNIKKACPVFWGEARHRLHWDFFDPAEAEGSEEEKLRIFRTVRDQIRLKLEEFVKERDDRDE